MIISRRELIKYASTLALPYLLNSFPVNAKEDIPEAFKSTLQVHVYGASWLKENQEKVDSLHENQRKRIQDSKDPVLEFITLDFSPKSLVRFDIYSEGKPVVTNIREDNYQKIVLPVPQKIRDKGGKLEYTYQITLPPGSIKINPDTFQLISDEDLKTISQERDQVTTGLVPLHNYQGVFPRSFRLERGPVTYLVNGLESLFAPNASPEEFAEFWPNREKFKGNYSNFLAYYRKHTEKPLMIHEK